jgi:2-keto-myo-inositol isomerase
MLLCLNTSTIMPQPLLEKIRLTAEAGFPAIELWINDIYEFVGQGGEVRDVEKALADCGLLVPAMIAVRGWAEATQEEYPFVLEEAKRRMELAARLGARWLVCSPARGPCSLAQITRRYKDLLQLGRQLGIQPTFEYISFFESASRLEQAWQVVRDVDDPDATLIVDAFHSWNSGSHPSTLREIPVQRISHYHIDDAAPGIPPGRQRDADRVMVGDGVIDLAGELSVLAGKGYRGAVSLELFQPQLWAQDPLTVLRTGRERMEAILRLAGKK